MEGKKGCKIRKRGCCSSSSSSSVARRNRFKRAILAGKRYVRGGGGVGSGTPVRSLTVAGISPENFLTEAQNGSVSARKLAATLWEISSSSITQPGNSKRDCLRSKKPERNREKETWDHDLVFRFGSDKINQRMERSGDDLVRRTPKVCQNLTLIHNKTVSMKSAFQTETRHRRKHIAHLKDVSDGLTTSRELVKLLTRIEKLGDHHHHHHHHHHGTARKRLISALQCELDRARSYLKRLMREQSEGDAAAQLRRWRRRTEKEMTEERNLRRQAETVNKKLRREVAEAKAETQHVTEELKREKRAKEILEQVCDELVRGVGEDKAEAERLRKETERVTSEMEKEREMMHLADVLREERVQMKLTEARFEFEEKNAAAVERLRRELRRVLKEEGNGSPPWLRRIKLFLEEIDGEGEGSDRESDLKSIELNMDSVSKSYKWGYVGSGQFSGISRRRDTGFSGSGDEDDDDDGGRRSVGDSEESMEKASVIVDFQTRDEDEIDRDKSIKGLRDYIISNARFVGSSEKWNQIEEVSPE